MMLRIEYHATGRIGVHDAAFVDATDQDDQDLAEQVARSVVDSVALDVRIEIGGIIIHLAMLLDPDHWADDWRECGVDDVEAFLAGLVTEYQPF